MSDNVTPLRPGPLLSDIPGMLRLWADRIENGDEPADTVLMVIPRDGDWPKIIGLGQHLGDLSNVAIMELAKTWFINNTTAR